MIRVGREHETSKGPKGITGTGLGEASSGGFTPKAS